MIEVYNVGRHRNDIKHSNPIKTEERIVKANRLGSQDSNYE